MPFGLPESERPRRRIQVRQSTYAIKHVRVLPDPTPQEKKKSYGLA